MNINLRAPKERTSSGLVTPTRARYFLGIVRLINGVGATFVPEQFSKRMGVDVSQDPAVIYPLRMFGIRTLLIAGDLLFRRGDSLRSAIQISPVIHAADASAAIVAGVKGQLPRKTAATGAVISLLNLGLAIKMVLATRRDAQAEA